MAQVVHAIFGGEAEAAPSVKELAARTDKHPSFAVQVFTTRPLDGGDLPESGTEVGRNAMVATGVGAGAGLVLGIIVGSTEIVLGMGPGMGAAVGSLFGVLVGMLSGMMAGARQPKAKLSELAECLGSGKALLTIEVDDTGHAELVEDLLRDAGASCVGRC